MAEPEIQRDQMVERQIARRGVRDPRVLDAMRRTPRELFVPRPLREFAYDDSPLPIAEGQTISQPYIVALMLQAAEIDPEDRVLEVGTGSGYAAAVLSRLAGRVYTIERHAGLTEAARTALAEAGCANVEVRHGDGTHGWPEADPFDAIIVSAGGPKAPETLREQLAIGGRLVIPIGESRRRQRLVKITRAGPDDYREEDLGDVAFVPLIGEHGWREKRSFASDAASKLKGAFSKKRGLPGLIARAAEPLPEIEDPAFADAFDRFAQAKVVLLGEATHGTSEFYRARAAITRRLIEKHGFTIVAVEADWPDAKSIDRYVRWLPHRIGEEPAFHRFPQWMWRNHEVQDFVDWLRAHNAAVAEPERRAGFFGLDLYSLSASISEVIHYLDGVDPETAQVARERYGCLTPWQKDPAIYGRAALSGGYPKCEKAVLKMLRELMSRRGEYLAQDGESFLDAAQNARLVAAAERYYRAMYYGSAESWNLRDSHMFETLEQLLESRGPEAKAVVWAHNSHIGDASATEMGVSRGEHNLGQLCRARWGDAAVLIGFGTDRGTVAAATDWDGQMEIKRVRPSEPGSYEHQCEESGAGRFLLDLGEGANEEARHELLSPRLERFIGVIYRPQTELQSHYMEASLPQQFDAWVWFPETHAVAPLPAEPSGGLPDTYPFGL
ncbi:MAG TPA: protein-L-isoaspartate(D-aspartate) O-methyltransferase [Caulobacteraceae bacterium]